MALLVLTDKPRACLQMRVFSFFDELMLSRSRDLINVDEKTFFFFLLKSEKFTLRDFGVFFFGRIK